MRRIRQWTSGALTACALAAGVGGCGEASSNDGDADPNAAADGSGGSSSGGDGDSNTASGNGDATTGVVTGESVSLDEYDAAFASFFCEWLTPCCAEIDPPVTQEDCIAHFVAAGAEEDESANPDNYTYDPESAGACVASMREAYGQRVCGPDWELPTLSAEAEAQCERASAGKLEAGAPCVSDIECARAAGDSVDCTEVGTDDATVCVVERRAAEGEPCYATCTEDADGTYCSPVPGALPTALQGQCFTNDQLYCGRDGLCTRQPALGEPCQAYAICTEGQCLDGTCSPGDAVVPCEEHSECGEGRYCEQRVCARQKRSGEPCEDPLECLSFGCGTDDGVCADGAFAGIAILCLGLSGQL